MRNRVGLLRIGDELHMKILRDGKTRKITAKIAEPKLISIAGNKLTKKLAGATLAQVQDPSNPQQTRVVVAEVKQGSAAWYARLQKGDYILSINRQVVDSLATLKKLTKNQRQILMSIQRGDHAMFVLLK